MYIADELNKITLPETLRRNGKECFFDTYRKKIIEVTPEEKVRQKIAGLFQMKYGVPKEMIWLEVPMSYYVENVPGRADIIIHFEGKDGLLYPVAVIECKNERVFLTDRVTEQAIRYCDAIGAMYYFVTNGIDLYAAVYDEKSDSYHFLDNAVSYKKMLEGNFEIPKKIKPEFPRFTMEQLQDQKLISDYNTSDIWIFGLDTEERIRSFSVNFYQALMDDKHRLPQIKTPSFEMVEDIGIRIMDYSNAGGGHYYGQYRAFWVNDRFGEPQIVSFSVFGTDPDFRGENRTSYTSLVVAVDRFKTSHNSLQYNIDRFAKYDSGNTFSFKHNGQISSMKSLNVIDIVSKHGHGIKVDAGEIVIGTVDASKLLYLDSKDVSALIYNFIEYALLREELRMLNKKK